MLCTVIPHQLPETCYHNHSAIHNNLHVTSVTNIIKIKTNYAYMQTHIESSSSIRGYLFLNEQV